MHNLAIIEREGQRVLTTQQLAESYQVDDKKIRDNYTNNKQRYMEGKHYFKVEGDDLRDLKNDTEIFGAVGTRASSVYLWTERGALLHAKSLNTEKAWQVYDMLVETYFSVKDGQAQLQNLSPQLQLLINMELEQKKLQVAVKETRQEVQAIREVVEIKPWDNWREDTNKIIRKICYQLKDYQKPKEELYKALQERGACDLKRRLENMRARLILNGGTRSKADNLNYLDVIAEDKKLIEIYTAIVKEMAIKYKVA